jgi:hypothetical protein
LNSNEVATAIIPKEIELVTDFKKTIISGKNSVVVLISDNTVIRE